MKKSLMIMFRYSTSVTDGRTDIIRISLSHVIMLTRDNKSWPQAGAEPISSPVRPIIAFVCVCVCVCVRSLCQ